MYTSYISVDLASLYMECRTKKDLGDYLVATSSLFYNWENCPHHVKCYPRLHSELIAQLVVELKFLALNS